jgi:SsrA-binding protein
MSKNKKKTADNSIVINKKARHDFFIEESFEAGIALEGWEVKSLRAGRIQIKEAYVTFKDDEAYLFGATISPLPTASTHISPDPTRTRKLLLHRRELDKLSGNVERKGYSVVPLSMHWHKGRAKLNIGLAKGKQSHDKRQTVKQRDWNREKQRILKNH